MLVNELLQILFYLDTLVFDKVSGSNLIFVRAPFEGDNALQFLEIPTGLQLSHRFSFESLFSGSGLAGKDWAYFESSNDPSPSPSTNSDPSRDNNPPAAAKDAENASETSPTALIVLLVILVVATIAAAGIVIYLKFFKNPYDSYYPDGAEDGINP